MQLLGSQNDMATIRLWAVGNCSGFPLAAKAPGAIRKSAGVQEPWPRAARAPGVILAARRWSSAGWEPLAADPCRIAASLVEPVAAVQAERFAPGSLAQARAEALLPAESRAPEQCGQFLLLRPGRTS